MSDSEDEDEDDESPKAKKGSKEVANKDACLVICSLTPGKVYSFVFKCIHNLIFDLD